MHGNDPLKSTAGRGDASPAPSTRYPITPITYIMSVLVPHIASDKSTPGRLPSKHSSRHRPLQRVAMPARVASRPLGLAAITTFSSRSTDRDAAIVDLAGFRAHGFRLTSGRRSVPVMLPNIGRLLDTMLASSIWGVLHACVVDRRGRHEGLPARAGATGTRTACGLPGGGVVRPDCRYVNRRNHRYRACGGSIR